MKKKKNYLYGHVLSDLHLFAKRSDGSKYEEKIIKAAQESDFIVLCGDIFDFKWTIHNSIEESIEHALDWIRLLCNSAPKCNVYYIMGNHDGIKLFKEPLNVFSEKTDNFSWHSAYFQIGDVLFIHGDIPFATKGVELSNRKLKQLNKPKGKIMNHLYQWFTNSGGLKVYRFLCNKMKINEYIYQAIKTNRIYLNSKVKRVYFGHSHIPFSDVKYNGLSLNNAGSAIKGLTFNMMGIEISDKGS